MPEVEKMLTKIKEPGSAITHFIGMVLAALAAIPMLLRAASASSPKVVVSLFIFAVSIIGLYTASTAYHTFDISPRVNTFLQKIDHIMISVLIAGTYTPVCTAVIGGHSGKITLIVIWSLAALQTLLNIFYIRCPKWLSSAIYIGMGWICVHAFGTILGSIGTAGFVLLLSGGIVYTAGGVVYALKMPGFNSRHPVFGTHEIFHLFVMAGSVLHFLLMFIYVK